MLLLALMLVSVCAGEEKTYIHTEFVIERFLAQVPEYEYYAEDPQSTCARRVMFFAEEELTDLRYLRVEPRVDEEGEVVFVEKECLLALPVFSPDKPLLIEMEFAGDLPARAFRFTAPDGSKQSLCLALSGECDMPVLAPCAVESGGVPYLTAEFVIERFLAQVAQYEYYAEAADSPYASRLVVFAEAELTDVRVVEVEAEIDEEGEVTLRECGTSFVAENIGPEKPLVLEMELPEILPRRVLSFLTPEGERRFCYPILSGRDGLPLLVPCLVETE